MRYFIKTQAISPTIGPYSIEEIEARLKAGELSADALAAADLGERPEKVKGWICVHQIPGLGGNPPMPNLEPPRLPTSPKDSQKASEKIPLGQAVCGKCSRHLADGETTVCRECGENMAPTTRQSAGPHPLFVLFVQVPVGFFVQFVSFVILCMFLGAAKGGAILVAVCLCVAWGAFGVAQLRKPASAGYGFGILLGVCLTGLLTGTCALSK